MPAARDDDWDDWDDSIADDDIEVDVCQHCGGYFQWTDTLRNTWLRTWQPEPNERQPQRCMRCLTDDAWIDDRS